MPFQPSSSALSLCRCATCSVLFLGLEASLRCPSCICPRPAVRPLSFVPVLCVICQEPLSLHDQEYGEACEACRENATFCLSCGGFEKPLRGGFCQECSDYSAEEETDGSYGMGSRWEEDQDEQTFQASMEDAWEEEEEPCTLCGLLPWGSLHAEACSCSSALENAHDLWDFMLDSQDEEEKANGRQAYHEEMILASNPSKPHRKASRPVLLSTKTLRRLQDPQPSAIPQPLPTRTWRMEHLRFFGSSMTNANETTAAAACPKGWNYV